jgi:hypothetical protein
MENQAKPSEQRREQPIPHIERDHVGKLASQAVPTSAAHETVDAREEIEGRRRVAKFRGAKSTAAARAAARPDPDGEQGVPRSG